jgi:hypothetical protein
MPTETIPELVRAEARLPWWMTGCTVAGTLVALLGVGTRFAVGVAFGGALAVLNYCWLHQIVAALVATARPRLGTLDVLKFAVRFPLAFAAIYLFYRTGWLPFTAVLAGLFVPCVGVLIECVAQVSQGWRCHEEG